VSPAISSEACELSLGDFRSSRERNFKDNLGRRGRRSGHFENSNDSNTIV
jgi:hypothetical protein